MFGKQNKKIDLITLNISTNHSVLSMVNNTYLELETKKIESVSLLNTTEIDDNKCLFKASNTINSTAKFEVN